MIEDALIVSILASAAAFLWFGFNKPNEGKRRKNVIEQWSMPISNDTESKVEREKSKEILSILKQKLKILFPEPPFSPIGEQRRRMFGGSLKMLNKRNILKEIKVTEGPKSFTINKREIFLCLKDKNDARYYDLNSLIFVFLHEMAHVLCDEVGHTQKFTQIFKELLEHAHYYGVYDPTKPFVKNYCPS